MTLRPEALSAIGPDELEALAQTRDRLHALRRRWFEARLDLVRWLPHQVALACDDSLFRLLRAGNQVGKSEIGLGEVIWAAAGYHPWRSPTIAAGEYWVICASFSQSLKVQEKFHALVPKHLLKPGTTFTKEFGYRRREPQVMLRHVDGTYSLIVFKTTGQEQIDLATATIDGVLFDEPPKDPALFAEIQKRVQALGGWILLTLTPIGADVTWLKALVDDGVVSETHAPMRPEALIPVGEQRPLRMRDKRGRLFEWNADWVEHITRLTPLSDRAIRIDGEWDVKARDAYFGDVWLPSEMVVRGLPDVPVWARLGIDHGHRPGKQYAVLLYVDDTVPDDPVVYAAAEYSDDAGLADQRVDAAGILDMLEQLEWEWSDLAAVGGDRDHMSGTEHRKSNRELEFAICDELGITHVEDLDPRIRTVKRGAGRNTGSVDLGLRWLYRLMARRRFYVHERCYRLRRTLPRFVKRSRDDEWKDVLDAVRYGLEELIFERRESTAPASRLRIG